MPRSSSTSSIPKTRSSSESSQGETSWFADWAQIRCLCPNRPESPANEPNGALTSAACHGKNSAQPCGKPAFRPAPGYVLDSWGSLVRAQYRPPQEAAANGGFLREEDGQPKRRSRRVATKWQHSRAGRRATPAQRATQVGLMSMLGVLVSWILSRPSMPITYRSVLKAVPTVWV